MIYPNILANKKVTICVSDYETDNPSVWFEYFDIVGDELVFDRRSKIYSKNQLKYLYALTHNDKYKDLLFFLSVDVDELEKYSKGSKDREEIFELVKELEAEEEIIKDLRDEQTKKWFYNNFFVSFRKYTGKL